MFCQIAIDGDKWHCPACGMVGQVKKLPIIRECRKLLPASERKPVPRGAGTWLKVLLSEMGIKPTDQCNCSGRAIEMDARGPEWCRASIEDTVSFMAEEARKQGLTFVESQSRWLVELAIRLSEEQRQPSKIERIRLRAMRFGNRLLN